MSTQLGIIGVGLLGSAMAERAIEHRFDVVGFDVDDARREQLQQMGGAVAESARDVAAAVDRLLLSLPDSTIVQSVVEEIEGVLHPNATVIDTTTGAPEATEAVVQRLKERNVDYLDATVAGSSKQAQAGDVVMMVGGARETFESCKDIFDALAKQVFRVGPSGSGARMKLVVNLVLGLNRAVLAEGLALAKHAGIDAETALDVLRSGAAYSAAMDTKGAKMITEDFSVQARLAQHLKDVRLILEMGNANDARLPLSEVHRELLERAVELGYADADNSAVIKAFD